MRISAACRIAVSIFILTGLDITKTASIKASAQTLIQICEPMYRDGPDMCLGEVYATPLGNRMPVILIHGWNRDIPGPPDAAVWDNLREYMSGVSWFGDDYKVYLVTYYSNIVSVRTISQIFASLIDEMDARVKPFSKKAMFLMGHSMGGLVARSFMQEGRLANGRGIHGGTRVARLVTLATPHHGTPVANGPARDDKAWPLANFLFTNFDDGFFGGTAWAQYNRYELHWDNYDKLFDYERFSSDDNAWLRGLNRNNSYNWKTSVYGGIAQKRGRNLLDCVLYDFDCMSRIITDAFGVSQNDGVVPLDSATFSPCSDCYSVQVFSGYNHSEMVRGKSAADSNLFGAILGDLSDIAAISDSRFNNEVSLGDLTSESFHNLRGWGEMNVPTEQGVSRYQTIRGNNSIDLFVSRPADAHVLSFKTEDGICDDSFAVRIDGYKDPIYFYSHGQDPGYPVHKILVPAKYLSKKRVTVIFENTAQDDCGRAAVYRVRLDPS